MFERFSASARNVVADAYEVARAMGNSHIDTRHLVAVLAERPGTTRDALDSLGFAEQVAQAAKAEVREDGLDSEALASLGIDLESVRRETEKTFGPNALNGAPRRRGASMRFEAEAKKALELAVRETIRLKSRSISDETLTLGIIRATAPVDAFSNAATSTSTRSGARSRALPNAALVIGRSNPAQPIRSHRQTSVCHQHAGWQR